MWKLLIILAVIMIYAGIDVFKDISGSKENVSNAIFIRATEYKKL